MKDVVDVGHFVIYNRMDRSLNLVKKKNQFKKLIIITLFLSFSVLTFCRFEEVRFIIFPPS